MRDGTKMGDVKFFDTMVKDGLWDAFNGYHMGTTAENVAKQWQMTREEQDKLRRRLAEQGRGRTEGRQVQGRDRARSTIKTKKGETVVDTDEYIKRRRHARKRRQAAPGFRPEGRLRHRR